MNKQIELDYHYGRESGQYSFFKIPKVLMEDRRFEKVSLDSKFLYGLMLDRMELSQKNGWLDEENRVFIYFSTDEVMKCLKCGKEKAVRLLAELDKGIGLIERKRQGQGKPSRIYVKHFARLAAESTSNCETGNSSEVGLSKIQKFDYRTSKGLCTDAEPPEVGKPDLQKSDNGTSASLVPEPQDVRKSNCNDTDGNYTDFNDTESIIPTHRAKGGGMDEIDKFRDEIREQIDYHILLETHSGDELDAFVDLMIEVAISKRDAIRIGGEDYPTEYVRQRFRQLDQTHITYIVESLRENTASVRNIKSYLMSALFYAPVTIDQYYSGRVKRDMGGG